MKRIIYDGPSEGSYKHPKFANAMTALEELTLAGTYDIPSKNESDGSIGAGWRIGDPKEKERIVYLARYSNRNSKFVSFFKGPKKIKNVKIEIEARKIEKLDGIEAMINEALNIEKNE